MDGRRPAAAAGNARGITERLARSCSRHPRRTLAAWGVAVLVSLGLVATTLGELTTDATVNGNPESRRASAAIARAFPPSPAEAARQTTDVVIVRSERYTVDAPQFGAFLRRLIAAGRATGDIAEPPNGARAAPPVSRDRHAVLLPIAIMDVDGAADVVDAVRRADQNPDFAVSITGDRTVDNDFNALSQRDLEHGELLIGMPAALIVLLLVFGSLVGGLVPLLMAILSIVVGMGFVALLSLRFELSVFIVNMLTGMGLALGIDYSLFVVSRYREERLAGGSRDDAIARTGATASRAVLFSGSTFVVALLGMLLVPTSIMRSLAAGAIVVGIVSVAAALTLLPALLGVLGDRVNALRVPIVGRNLGRADAAEGRFWQRIIGAVLERPALSLTLATAALLAAASPLLGMHIGQNSVTTLPDSMASKRGYIALQRDFPARFPDPVEIVVQGADQPAVHAGVQRLRDRLASDPRFGPGEIRRSAGGDVALLTVPVRGDNVGPAAISAVRDVHDDVAPQVFAGTDARVLVGGQTAETAEYFDAVTQPTPWVFLFVLGLSLILLTVAFRSLVVALVSIVLNLLSVGAAYGLLVLVFIHGVGADLLGFRQVETIDAWVPLFLFSVLFGLSMDYQVFLLSRIKERYDAIGDTRRAVSKGVTSTARIITGAALIIVAVFAGFAQGELVMFQQMGFGVAVALLIDATVIRSVVLPSLMTLLGRRCWYLPSWLEWLPHVEVEAGAPAARSREPLPQR
jgi:putative drug exporter of the RND superfamily